jgi:hypothetical protein
MRARVPLRSPLELVGDEGPATVHGPNKFQLTDSQLLTDVTERSALHQHTGGSPLQIVWQCSTPES